MSELSTERAFGLKIAVRVEGLLGSPPVHVMASVRPRRFPPKPSSNEWRKVGRTTHPGPQVADPSGDPGDDVRHEHRARGRHVVPGRPDQRHVDRRRTRRVDQHELAERPGAPAERGHHARAQRPGGAAVGDRARRRHDRGGEPRARRAGLAARRGLDLRVRRRHGQPGAHRCGGLDGGRCEQRTRREDRGGARRSFGFRGRHRNLSGGGRASRRGWEGPRRAHQRPHHRGTPLGHGDHSRCA